MLSAVAPNWFGDTAKSRKINSNENVENNRLAMVGQKIIRWKEGCNDRAMTHEINIGGSGFVRRHLASVGRLRGEIGLTSLGSWDNQLDGHADLYFPIETPIPHPDHTDK